MRNLSPLSSKDFEGDRAEQEHEPQEQREPSTEQHHDNHEHKRRSHSVVPTDPRIDAGDRTMRS